MSRAAARRWLRRASSTNRPSAAGRCARRRDRAGEVRARPARLEHAEHRLLFRRAGARCARHPRRRRRGRSSTSGIIVERGRQALRAPRAGRIGRRRRSPRRPAAWILARPRADPAEGTPIRSGKKGPSRNRRKVLAQHGRGEVAAGDDEGGADRFAQLHAASSAGWPIRAPPLRRRWRRRHRAGRAVRSLSVSMPAPPSISALSKRLGPPFRQLESPFAARRSRRREWPRATARRRRGCAGGRSGASRPRASSTAPSNATLPAAMMAMRSHRRSAWAMTWVEKMIVRPRRLARADQLLELALVDGVEAGEGLVEDDQPRLVDDGAEQLHGLRHALGQGPDRLARPVAEAVGSGEQLDARGGPRERQAAQRAHEGDRPRGLIAGYRPRSSGR